MCQKRKTRTAPEVEDADESGSNRVSTCTSSSSEDGISGSESENKCLGSSSSSENDELADANQPCTVTVRSGEQSMREDNVGPDGAEHPSNTDDITLTASAQQGGLS